MTGSRYLCVIEACFLKLISAALFIKAEVEII